MKTRMFVMAALAIVCTGCCESNRETAFRLADAVVVTAKCAGERERGALATAAADLTNVIFHVTRRRAPICEEGAEPKEAAVRIYLGPTEAARTAFMEPARRKECLEQVATDIELLTLKFNDLPAELKGVPADELVCVDYHFRRDGKKVEDKASERRFSVKAVGYKGGPLVCGVYDEQSKDSYGFRIAPDAQPKDGLFHWAKLGRCHNGHNSIFWFPGTWYSSFKLKDKYIQADGLAVDPNWYEVWASVRFADGEAFIDRLAFRRVPPPQGK